MATATELTLTLGRTVYSGDPDSDERLQAREARVSVTWSLDEDEQDLTVTTSALAEEVERALAQVVQPLKAANSSSVGNGSTRNGLNGCSNHPGNGSGYGNENGYGNGRSHQAGPEAVGGKTAIDFPETTSEEPTTPHYGGYIPPRTGNGHSGSAGSGMSAGNSAQDQRSTPASAKTQSAATHSAAKTQAITKTQCLAVHSHCTRRGIAQWELLRLVAEQFGKRNLEDLDKAQGGELLNMLQQAEHEQRSGNPDYAN